jgi:hypothetical protein
MKAVVRAVIWLGGAFVIAWWSGYFIGLAAPAVRLWLRW